MSVFNTICCLMIVFLSLASKNMSERLTKRQTDSFVVHANYGVQSVHLTTASPATHQNHDDSNLPTLQENITEPENLPTPNAWIGSNNFLIDPYTRYQGNLENKPPVDKNKYLQIYKGNHENVESAKKPILENVVHASTTSEPNAQIMYNKRIDHYSSGQDLQKIIGKLVKGASKVHQVVKVPAVYEIHLEEEEPIHAEKFFNLPLPEWQKPLTRWNQVIPTYNKLPSHYYLPTHNNRIQDSRGMHYTTTTWNLPKKIRYFNKHLLGDRNGKYSHPRPFALQDSNNGGISLETWNNNPSQYQRHAPISQSSSRGMLFSSPPSVSYSNSFGNQNSVGTPDLSLYYAKKREISGTKLSSRNDGFKRFGNARRNNNGLGFQSGKQRFEKSFRTPFTEGVSYVIHVREKSSE